MTITRIDRNEIGYEVERANAALACVAPIDGDRIGKLAIFLLQETGSIWGTWEGRMPVAKQRELFGYAPFGRKTVRVKGLGETVSHTRSVCFGTDWHTEVMSWRGIEGGFAFA